MNTAYYTRSNELYHYGVPGMKWGHRKAKAPLKYKTDKISDKISNAKNNKIATKNLKKYIKVSGKDMKKAYDANDEKTFNKISAGRTYAKMLIDQNYLTNALTNAAIQAKVPIGEQVAYNIIRNETKGSVDIKINDKSTSSYVYFPKSEKFWR